MNENWVMVCLGILHNFWIRRDRGQWGNAWIYTDLSTASQISTDPDLLRSVDVCSWTGSADPQVKRPGWMTHDAGCPWELEE